MVKNLVIWMNENIDEKNADCQNTLTMLQEVQPIM